MDTLDVRGLSCPIPVLKTKKALDQGQRQLQIIGTGNTAKENVTKFVHSQGLKVEVTEAHGEWQLIISPE